MFWKMGITHIQDQSKMLMLCSPCPVGEKEMEIWTDLLCETIWQVVEFCNLARSEALSLQGKCFGRMMNARQGMHVQESGGVIYVHPQVTV